MLRLEWWNENRYASTDEGGVHVDLLRTAEMTTLLTIRKDAKDANHTRTPKILKYKKYTNKK